VLAEVKDLEQRVGPSTRPTRRSSCCCAEEVDLGQAVSYFDVESWRVITDARRGVGEATSEATVKLTAGGRRHVATGEGNGPVNALDHALRQSR
jgi:2-isopropylmalate synthase